MSRSWVAALVALALLLLALPAAASAAVEGEISGKVTQAGVGAPVQGAEVCAESEADFECALTDAGGEYLIVGLTPGSYFVGFQASESNPYVIFELYPTDVTVTEAKTPGIDAAVAIGGAIAGKVTDALTGLPLEEVEVCSWPEGSEGFDGCDFTAADGTYEIGGASPGLHELEFWAFEGNYEPQVLRQIPALAGVRTAPIDAALVHEVPAEGRISGHVYSAAIHAPLPGVAVCGVWADNGETGGCTLTSASGGYLFYPVDPGTLKIVFSPEPAETEFNSKVKADAWPTQWWNQKPTFAAADTLTVTPTSNFTGIDGLLGPGPPPASSPPPATTTPAPVAIKPKPKPKRLHCGKGKVKKRVKAKVRCVKRHKPRHHHKKHRARH